jgi:hypothetical protein
VTPVSGFEGVVLLLLLLLSVRRRRKTTHRAERAPKRRIAPMAEPRPMPAFAPVLRLGDWEVEGVVGVGRGMLLGVGVEVVVKESVVSRVEDDVVEVESVVDKWFANHSIVPPYEFGRRATSSRTFGAEKATAVVSDLEGHVHWSPWRMNFGLSSSSQATLCVLC